MSEVPNQIKVGDPFPDVTVYLLEDGKVTPKQTHDLFKDKKVVLFGIPGAFTPTCTNKHCPAYVMSSKILKSKGVDLIAMTSTNDAFVLDVFAKSQKSDGIITMLSDGNGSLSKALGVDVVNTQAGMGIRCRRFAMIIDSLSVVYVGVEAPGALEASMPNAILSKL